VKSNILFDDIEYIVDGGKLLYIPNFLNQQQIDYAISAIEKDFADDNIDKVSNVNDFSRQISVAYGDIDYTYSTGTYGDVTHKSKPIPVWLYRLCRLVEKRLQIDENYYNHILINKFEDDEGIGYHRDDESIYKDKDGNIGSVVILSIGDVKGLHSFEKTKIKVEHNSMVVMSSGYILHKVAKSKGIRYSVTFRHLPKVSF
jgi:alkylated DNA repair dioxygenase AlkB